MLSWNIGRSDFAAAWTSELQPSNRNIWCRLSCRADRSLHEKCILGFSYYHCCHCARTESRSIAHNNSETIRDSWRSGQRRCVLFLLWKLLYRTNGISRRIVRAWKLQIRSTGNAHLHMMRLHGNNDQGDISYTRSIYVLSRRILVP